MDGKSHSIAFGLGGKKLSADLAHSVLSFLTLESYGSLTLTSKAYRDTVQAHLQRTICITLDIDSERESGPLVLRREVAGLQLVAKHCDHLQTLVIPVPQKLYTRFDRDRVMPLLERLVLANRRSLRRVSGDVLHARFSLNFMSALIECDNLEALPLSADTKEVTSFSTAAARAIKRCKLIKELSVGIRSITSQPYEAMRTMLEAGWPLEKLTLDPVTNATVAKLGEQPFAKTLQHLTLRWSNYTDEKSCEVLLEQLQKLQALTELRTAVPELKIEELKRVTLPHLRSLEITGPGCLPVIAPSLTSLTSSTDSDHDQFSPVCTVMRRSPQLQKVHILRGSESGYGSDSYDTLATIQPTDRSGEFSTMLNAGHWLNLQELHIEPVLDAECIASLTRLNALKTLRFAASELQVSTSDIWNLLKALTVLEELRVNRDKEPQAPLLPQRPHKVAKQQKMKIDLRRKVGWDAPTCEPKVLKALKSLSLDYADDELFSRFVAPSLQTLTLRGQFVEATSISRLLQSAVKSHLLSVTIVEIAEDLKLLTSTTSDDQQSDNESEKKQGHLPSMSLTVRSSMLTSGSLVSIAKTLGPFLRSLDLTLTNKALEAYPDMASLPDVLAAIPMLILQSLKVSRRPKQRGALFRVMPQYAGQASQFAGLLLRHTALRAIDIEMWDPSQVQFYDKVLEIVKRERPGDKRLIRATLGESKPERLLSLADSCVD